MDTTTSWLLNSHTNVLRNEVQADTDLSRKKDDMRLSRFVAAFFVVQAINLTVKLIFPISGDVWRYVSFGLATWLAVLLCLTIRPIFRRAFFLFLASEVILSILFLVSCLMGNADNALLLEGAFWSLGICIPISISAYAIQNKSILYLIMMKYSYIITILMGLVLFSPISNSRYNMSFSYALLLPALFHVNEWLNTFKIRYFFLVVAEIIAIFMFGARGPLMCIVVMFVFKYLLSKNKNIKWLILGVISVISVIVFYIFFDDFGNWVMFSLGTRGYYSRTLSLIFQGRLTYDSGRLGLFQYYIELASRKPLFGWGLLGGWMGKGSGPHNTLIGLLLAFGYIFGGFACAALIVLFFQAFFIKPGPMQDLLIIFTSYNVSMYTVSGDFLMKPTFFLFVILSTSVMKRQINKYIKG